MSGRKNVLPPYHAISAQSMASNITGPSTNIQFTDNVCIQLNFTGTPTGAFNIQGSIDQQSWVTLSLSPNPSASGSAGNILLDLNQLSMPYIRVTYTATSGTGTLDAWIFGKMV